MADPSQLFKDKLIAYLKVEDLTQLVLVRRKPTTDEEESSPSKKSEAPTVNFSQLYDLKRILGAGGFGVVCEVVCRESLRPVALKITLWNEQAPSGAG